MEKKLNITLGFGAMVCLLGWLNWRMCLWFLMAGLVHELGHYLAMRLCGVPVQQVTLRAAGAVICGSFRGYRQEIVCAAAGPGTSFLLMICGSFLPELAIVSGLLGLVNLLPLYPLDGGRILRAALLLHLEEQRVKGILSRVSWVVCGTLMVAACWLTVERQAGIWPIFAALVLLWRAGDAKWTQA